MSVKSIRHAKEKRVLIPSQEEAGAEAASPKVKEGKVTAEYPMNPVVHRGQDPELFWMHKYGPDDHDDRLAVDIRSLYRHEHIAPEKIIQRLYRLKEVPKQQLDLSALFGNGLELDEIDKVSEYYKHAEGWSNRMQDGLLKRDKKAALFVTIGEPDVVIADCGMGNVELKAKGRGRPAATEM